MAMDNAIAKLQNECMGNNNLKSVDKISIEEILCSIKLESKNIKTSGVIQRKEMNAIKAEDSISVRELRKYNSYAFIEKCYQALLGRSVDEMSKNNIASNLKNGLQSKNDVIVSIRYSGEGREKNVKLRGGNSILFWGKVKRRLFRFPLIGRVLLRVYNRMNRNSILMQKLLLESEENQKSIRELYRKLDDMSQNN